MRARCHTSRAQVAAEVVVVLGALWIFRVRFVRHVLHVTERQFRHSTTNVLGVMGKGMNPTATPSLLIKTTLHGVYFVQYVVNAMVLGTPPPRRYKAF